MVSTRGSKVKAEPGTGTGTGTVKVKPEPKSRRSSGDGDGGVLGSPAPDKKKKATPKKKSTAKKKAPAKKAKPKKGPGVDLRGAAAKSKSAAVLSALKANALGPDSMEGKRAEKMKAMGRAASDATVVTHIPNAPETVRYSIEVAKTGRSACKKSKLMIPKGALRWQCYTNGIGRGWIMLEHVTPVMLRNAIVAHGSLTAIHGFESMQANDAVRVCNLFKDILKNGGTKKGKKKGKKKATKKKGKKKSGGGAEQTLDENTAEVEDDDEILVAATESIDEVLARKLKEATMSGNLEVLDFSDDEEEAEAEVPGATQATEATASTSKTEKVFEKVVPMEIDEDDDEEYDDDEEEEEEEEDQKAPDLLDRPPVEGDLVFVKWDGDPKEYLCLIAESSEGGLEITSADQEFEDAVDLDPNLDVWRFSAGAQKSAPKKLKHGKPRKAVGANPVDQKKKALASIKMGKNANALENLTFVITGATDERPRDEFGNYIQALVESHGGQMRGSISGRTDYLVCGTYHFNPFLGTVGAIENGSKYRNALEKGTKIIDGDMLVDIINGSGEV